MKRYMARIIAQVIVSPLLESGMAIMDALSMLAARVFCKAEHKKQEMLRKKQRVLNK